MSNQNNPLHALVSIHDVMPQTLPQCAALLEPLLARNNGPITLLVVPGRPWQASDLDLLRDWQRAGCLLAGHGWTHEVMHIRSLHHRLHSLLLSRRAAEHLSHDEDSLFALMQRCYDWFIEHDLQAPDLYVPPAWALGPVSHSRLASLPFTLLEVLSGVIRVADQQLLSLPLTGYEADNSWRALTLRPWNRLNEKRAVATGKPLRVGIHPYDDQLRLRQQLWQQLARCDAFVSYEDALAG